MLICLALLVRDDVCRETFCHLDSDCFSRFSGGGQAGASAVPSNEFAALLSSIRLKSSARVKSYLRKSSFLQEVRCCSWVVWCSIGFLGVLVFCCLLQI